MDYRDMTLSQVRALLRSGTPRDFKTTRAFLEGDHWQHGAGWVGPYPDASDEAAAEVWQEIERSFSSRNVERELQSRHVNGVVGLEPSWDIHPARTLAPGEKPTAEEDKLIAEVSEALTWWWNTRKIPEVLQGAVENAAAYGKGSLRLYVPTGYLTTETDAEGRVRRIVRADSLQQALSYIWPDTPGVEEAAVVMDEDRKAPVGVFATQVDRTTQAEVIYADGDDTVIRVLSSERGAPDREYRLPFGGRLTIYVVERPALLTTQTHQQQRTLNLAETMTARGIITQGFLELLLTNAQLPGYWEHDEAGNRTKFVPEAMSRGPGTINFVRGLDFESKEGETTLTTPGVNWREPVDLSPLIAVSDALYARLLTEAKQAHVLGNSEGSQSGVSRVQARADFAADLRLSATRVQAMGLWLLETVLAMAEAFAGVEAGHYTERVRFVFDVRINTGPLTPEEQKAIVEALDKGLVSKEEAAHRWGIQDVDAVLAQARKSPEYQAAFLARVGEALDSLITAGVSATAAVLLVARRLGLDAEEVELLTRTDYTPTVEQ